MRRCVVFGLVAVLTLFVVGSVEAQDPHPVGFSLVHPVQTPDANRSIRGVRFNVIYGVNRNLTGLDIGLLFPINTITNDLNGIQLGLYNRVGGRGKGLQWGAVNFVENDFTGLQTGFYNQAGSVHGTQLGLVNITDRLSGLQIGLANIKGQRGSGWPRQVPHEFFPIVNWTFR
jgi:hypothetical protein